MTDRDPHPDSPPEADHDRRSDLEQATTGTNRDIEQVEEAESGVTSEPPEGVDGAVGGTGGVTKNQEETAQ
ncbi:hypothetical protein M9978_01875 [Sphingomonas sp. MG17]|uniref:Uncharacterized protein n=1 Tax=Sphingomonas tagetis TaxID=2949092 RepID=A0A9X2KN06_9SPHN|nr:hypothetical protein [Sphingomonas tagetis]MCP3729163.1 hypothetical protein [Sphingomonas tagetis]